MGTNADKLLRRALALFVEMLAEAKPVMIKVDRGGLVAKLTIRPAVVKPTGEAEPIREEETTGTQDAILEALRAATEPLKASAIARRANCPYNSYFRSQLRVLKRLGKITSTPDYFYCLHSADA